MGTNEEMNLKRKGPTKGSMKYIQKRKVYLTLTSVW